MNELRLAFSDKRSNFGPGNFFQEFSLHVERRGIAYVILHGYEKPSFFPAYRCPSEPDTVPAALRAPAPAMAAPDEIQVAQNG
jgi:hypothetical protein